MLYRGLLTTGLPRLCRSISLSAHLSATRFIALTAGRHSGPKPQKQTGSGTRFLCGATASEMAVTFGNLSSREMSLVGTLILDLALNWGGWVIAAIFKTEKIYDAVGSLSFITVALSSLLNSGHYHARQVGVTCMVLLWTMRLGSFLLYRVIKFGGDNRFKEAVEKPGVYFVYWTMQAVWVWVCSLPLIFLNGSSRNPGLFPTDIIGIVLFATGFLMETTADFQKLFFKMDPENKGKFMNQGLWKYARYPNYCGEIIIWWGIFATAARGLHGVEFISVVSPLLTMTLLLGLSGIPIQEKQAKNRWGDDPAYQEYRRMTNLLLPIPKFWVHE